MYLNRGSGYKTATGTKQRHHKTATVTKQRQLQNSDCYKTATTSKLRLLQNADYYKMTTVAKKYFYIYIFKKKHYVRYFNKIIL